jgi:hypothetical protein
LRSNKLCLGSRIFPGCLGFYGRGFFRNGSHCQKVGVNLCLGCLSGCSARILASFSEVQQI